MKRLVKSCGYFAVLLLCFDSLLFFVIWLLQPSAVKSFGPLILLFTLIALAFSVIVDARHRRRISDAFENFLEMPDEVNKEKLVHATGRNWTNSIETLYEKMHFQTSRVNEKELELLSYKEFIESWVHEVKTPLSLSTLVLNNHKDEMSSYVYSRMNRVQRQLNNNIDLVLYYARLQVDHKEYKFTKFRLDLCIQEIVDDYTFLAGECHIAVHHKLPPLTLISDQKVLRFMISQLMNNALKYSDPERGEVTLSAWQNDDKIHLFVTDNGKGIPPEDAPFIFDKGFTGNHPDRQKATGMGLYLVEKSAEALCIEIRLDPISTTGKGFCIELIFTL